MDPRQLGSHALVWLAILIAAILQAVHVARSPTISADGITFIAIARDLPQGVVQSFRSHDQHPGYPAMLLAATRLVQWAGYRAEPGAWAVGGVIVSYMCGLGCVAMVWLLARNLFDTRAANVAALVFAALPVPCWSAGDAHSDTPHLLAYLTAAWLASAGVVSGRALPLAGAGAASAIAYWIRPEGLEVFLVALACLLWQSFRASWTWRRTSVACATLTGTALVIVAPYPILAGKITSKQLPFAKTYKVQTFIQRVARAEATADADAPPAETAPQETNLAVEPSPAENTAASAPAALARAPAAVETAAAPPRYSLPLVLRMLGKALATFFISMAQGFKFVFIPFYFIGHVACARRQPEWLQIAMLALLGVTHFLVLLGVYMLSGYIAHRHVLPLVGLAMPVTALGVIYVAETVARRLKTPPGYAVAIVLAVCCACVLPYSVRAVNREFIPVMAATRWVQDHAKPGSGVVCNSPYVGFYGTLPVAYLNPDAPTLDQALARANPNADYDFVVLHVNAYDYRPEWITQLEPHYRQVRLFDDPSSDRRPKKVLVFQAKDGHVRSQPRQRRS